MAIFKKTTCPKCKANLGRQQEPGKVSPPLCKCGAKGVYGKVWFYDEPYLAANGASTLFRIKSSKSTDRRDAETLLREAEDRVKKREVVARPTKIALEDAAKEWLEWCDGRAARGLKPGAVSVRNYRSVMESSVFPAIGKIRVDKLDRQVVKDYLNSRVGEGKKLRGGRRGKPITYGTIKQTMSTLRVFFSWCLDDRRYVSENFCKGKKIDIEMPIPQRAKKPPRFLTKEEIAMLLTECSRKRVTRKGIERDVYPPHLKLFVLVALDTGLRIDGVLSLRWDEIDFQEMVITKVVKTGKEIRFPFSPTVAATLKRQRHEQQNQKVRDLQGVGWVFPSPCKPGTHLQPTSKFGLGTACRSVGLKGVTPHILRHTWATHALEAAPPNMASVKAISEILGHSTPQITMDIYMHGDMERKRRIVNETSRILFGDMSLLPKGPW